MARSIDDKLQRLRARRTDMANQIFKDGFVQTELFEKRASTNATRYTLGAMQEVEPRYTEISIEEGERVKRNLDEGLKAIGLSAEYRLQGSVPLNVHTRGVSDVDLLAIEPRYLSVSYCSESRKSYLPYDGLGTLQQDILYLRNHCENILKTKFWGAQIDTSHAKCIKLSEGSLRRDVDVVPSAWEDTALYQMSLQETERGIIIVNKHTRERLTNFPFKYMAQINSKDIETSTGAKMAIRLLKNIKNDGDAELEMSSYDLGSLIFQCPSNKITLRPGADLMILSGVDEWFDELVKDRQRAIQLETPDGTRKILDTPEKWASLVRLSQDISELADAVVREIGTTVLYDHSPRDMMRKYLNEHIIPLAA